MDYSSDPEGLAENPFEIIDYVDLMSPDQKNVRDEASNIMITQFKLEQK